VFHGLAGRLAYGIDEGRTATGAMAPSIQPRVVSALVSYDRGPLLLRYAYELHLDYFGLAQQGGSPGASATNPSSTDMAHNVVASYTVRAAPGFDTRLVGVFEYLSYQTDDTAPGAVDEHARAAYYGLVDQTLLGKHHVWAAFGQALDGSCAVVGGGDCSTDGLGANMAVLGYIYRASKNTDLFAAAYRIGNQDSASYTTFPPLGPAGPGADIKGIGIGMLHQFSVTIAPRPRPAPTPVAEPAPVAPIPAPEPPAVPEPAPPAPAPPPQP
jgi:hypothetical protein